MSDHDSNPSQTMTLTTCPVGLVDHDSNPSQTMTLTTCPAGATWVSKLPGTVLGPSAHPSLGALQALQLGLRPNKIVEGGWGSSRVDQIGEDWFTVLKNRGKGVGEAFFNKTSHELQPSQFGSFW